VGAGFIGKEHGGEDMRVGPDRKPLVASPGENMTVPPIEATRYFADSAG